MAKFEILMSVHQAVVYEVEAASPEEAKHFQIGAPGVEEVSRKTIEAFICDITEVDEEDSI